MTAVVTCGASGIGSAVVNRLRANEPFPVVATAKPFPTTFRFKVGLYGATKHD